MLLTDTRVPPLVGILLVAVLALRGRHVHSNGEFAAQRITSVFLLSAASYVFAVLVYSQHIDDGPSLSILIEHGFGVSECLVVFSGALLHYLVRIWYHFVN